MVKLGRFHGLPKLVSLHGRHNYVLEQHWFNWFGYQAHGGEWLIPRDGTHTDQGSIPRIFWSLVPPDSYLSFYIHDALYEEGHYRFHDVTQDCMPDIRRPIAMIPISRDYADGVLLESMLTEVKCHNNGTKFEAYLIYYAVRLFGWIIWNRHKDGRIPSRMRFRA